MKKLLLALLLVTVPAVVFAAPAPPEKGQWAYALNETLPLYRNADSSSRYEEVDMPEKWISVPSAVRDDENYLWYKVKVNGRNGWLPQNGVRLKMGGKSKAAANLYSTYLKHKPEDTTSFSTKSSAECKKYLGVDFIGMSQDEVRAKMGTPTMRESPYEDIDTNILSYEIAKPSMTFAITLVGGYVDSVEFYKGRTGQN